MTNDEIKSILIKIKESTDRDEIINLKNSLVTEYEDLIINLANKYKRNEDEYDDLVQETYLNFLDSIDNYDINKNLKFDDFIKKVLETKTKESSTNLYSDDSFSDEISDVLNRILDAEEDFLIDNDRYPLDAELEEILNIKLEDIKKYKVYAVEILSLDKNDPDLLKKPLSLLVKESEKTNTNKLDEIDSESSELLNISLNLLNDKEKDIVKKYYGLDDEEKLSINEIANLYGITKERARQVLSLALKKLKREMDEDDEE